MKYFNNFFPKLYGRSFPIVLYMTLLLTLISGPCLSAEEAALTEEMDPETQRVSLSHAAIQPQPFMSGGPINCLFWGPYLHVDHIQLSSETAMTELRLPALLSAWATEKCEKEGFTKISFDVSDHDPSKDDIDRLFSAAAFSKKIITYQIRLKDAVERAQKKAINLEDVDAHMHALTLLDVANGSDLFLKAETLFCKFNPAMLVPGLFKASATAVLNNEGGIYVYQNGETMTVEGIISFGSFIDKNTTKGMVIDTLFVDESSRGKRLSTKLIQHLLQEAGRHNFQTLMWETGMGRDNAIRFYENLEIAPYGAAWRFQPPRSSLYWHHSGTVLKELFSNPYSAHNAVNFFMDWLKSEQ